MRRVTTPYEQLLRERGYDVARIQRLVPLAPGDYGPRVLIHFCDPYDAEHSCVVEADAHHQRVLVWPQ